MPLFSAGCPYFFYLSHKSPDKLLFFSLLAYLLLVFLHAYFFLKPEK